MDSINGGVFTVDLGWRITKGPYHRQTINTLI